MIKQKDIILDYIKKAELESNNSNFGLTTIEIADALNMYRSNVSALLNRMVEEKLLEKKGTRPLKYSIYKNRIHKDVFENLIGYDGSLKNAVQLAKASLMYPQEKLATLIVGPLGSGTSYLVRLIYEYGITTNVISPDEELIKIDCRYYVADREKLIEKKNNIGLLFIDNVDLLNDRDLFNLFELLKNKKLEDVNYEDIRFVVACNDMANPSIIKELSNIVPIKIELPELSKRPLKEKLELINRFFSIESQRSNLKLEVPANVISALLLYEPEDNVKGINRDIKVACANAYARNFVEKKETAKIYLNDFSDRVKDIYLNIRTNKDEINNLIDEDDIFLYDGKETSKKYSNYNEKGTLYEDLLKQLKALSERGIDDKVIQDLLSNNLTTILGDDLKREISTEQISKLVDKKIIDLTRRFIDMCQNKLNRRFKPSVFYGLALHLNALVFNNVKAINVSEETINEVLNNHPEEFKLASSLSLMINEDFDIELTLDDMIIISSFIIGQKENVESYPKLLYVLHGAGTAESLKNVTEQLCKTNNVYAYNMLLEDDINKSYEELKRTIIDIDGGSGVIVIYDMGSIATMLNRISNETKIQIRSIYQPITLIGIDVARKASMEKDIDQIYNSIYVDMANLKSSSEKPKAIITLCNTGEGGAAILSDYIDKHSRLEYKTFPLAITDRRHLINEVDKIREDYSIYCCVGTYNPNLYNVPFINISDIFSVRVEDLDQILQFKKPYYTNSDYDRICSYLIESSRYFNEEDIKNHIYPFIDDIKKDYKLDIDTETGLIVHLAALIDHILSGKKTNVTVNPDMYDRYMDDFRTIKKLAKKLEKRFKVIFSDDDIMLMVKMIRKV